MLMLLLNIIFLSSCAMATYNVGVGIADCTGPPTELIFMGYAQPSQVGCGLHLRQFARAFIINDGTKRTVFVSVDIAMISHEVKERVLSNLAKTYNNTYNEDNVIISSTHTHSTPGGQMTDFLYSISVFGFINETFYFVTEGITNAIKNAHQNLVEARIFINSGVLLDANINRSPASYLYNPEEERAKYDYNVDKDVVQLKFIRNSDNTPIGLINWFAVHGTSMNYSNCLVSSDNQGYASILFESTINQNEVIGKGPFVSAFASTNLGDVSPNIKGPICIDSGDPCDFETSTCHGVAELCIASGPGDNMFQSTKIIGERIYAKAKQLFEDEGVEITGPVNFIQQFVDMTKESTTIVLSNGTEKEVHGCLPAMGYSFAAGTTDGPGAFDFTQGTNSTNPLWNLARDAIAIPTKADIECQHPKPILLDTGRTNFPYEWQPKIVSTQIVQIGNVILLAVPGEFTTMCGRRLKEAVKEVVVQNGGNNNTKVVITGLSNTYSSYIATPEEYQLQRYEGASTIYGPYTCPLYINHYKKLATALMTGQTINPGVSSTIKSTLWDLVPPAGIDSSFPGEFGDCVQQPPATVSFGDIVVVKFICGNPRHNPLHGDSYLFVDQLVGSDWNIVATDANWETRFIWNQTNVLLGTSECTVEWEVGSNVTAGEYRIRQKGPYKSLFGGIQFYEGTTNKFIVE